jgi:hypothetical protein
MDIKINKIQYGLVQEKLMLLFDSVESIGNIKQSEDKFDIKCTNFENAIKDYQFEITNLKRDSKD